MRQIPTVLPSLTVSIVAHRSDLDTLRATLSSLASAARFALDGVVSTIKVQVVDNGSGDSYARSLAALVRETVFPEGCAIALHRLPVNRGFGAGHNAALKEVTSRYHLILNPDVELAAEALAEGVTRLEKDQTVALLSPYVEGKNGTQEYLCKRHPSVLVLLLRAFLPRVGRRLFSARLQHYEMSDVCGTVEAGVPMVSGCFMLARTAQLREVGGFDEYYFLYFEDFDLSLRLARFGTLLYTPQIRIVHHGGYAGNKGWRHLQLFARSGFRFFQRYGWRWV